MNGNRSVATIEAPEFINVTPYNPLISQCEIKVLYLGKNRNGSYIDKNTAIQMANSLPGCPIVGAYRADIEDFGDHGNIMHIEDGEITFSCKTRPYGFIAPDAQVWFKKFLDTDDFGNETEREYLMTTGYLWTGQYEEVADVVDAGKGQSMELDEKTLNGRWSEDAKSGISFFIINDAVFSKLCILGDDVEPCFEGASITTPQVSKEFTVDPDFSKTLFTMLKELKDALESKGGSSMGKKQEFTVECSDVADISNVNDATDATDSSALGEATEEFTDANKAADVEETVDTSESTEFEAEDAAEDAADDVSSEELEDAPVEDNQVSHPEPEIETVSADEDGNDVADDDDNDETGSLIPRIQMTADEIEDLRAEVEELRQFKANVESQQKDALIKKYFMLSDEDKAEIIEHKNEYSLDEIESKLALLYVQKNVNFSIEEEEQTPETDFALSFDVDDEEVGSCSGILAALRETVHE